MDSQSYPCKTKSAHETEKNCSKNLEPSQATIVVYTDNSMEFGRACGILSWNHRTETNGIAEIAVRRVKEGTSAVLLQSGLDERWWSDSMECHCYLRNVQDLLADGKNTVWKTIWRIFQRGNNTFWSNGRISSVFTERSVDNSSIWQESTSWKLSWLWTDREGEFGNEISWYQTWKIWKIWMHQIFSLKNQSKGSIDQSKNDEFIFPIADGTAKLSGRHHEFRETTVRLEQPVRSEDLSGEIQDESEESQPAEPADDAEAHADFLVDSRWLHLSSSQWATSTTACRRKKHSPFVMQEKKIDDYWNVDSSKHLLDSWTGFTKFILLKEKLPKRIYVVRMKNDKRSIDDEIRLCMSRSMDENW